MASAKHLHSDVCKKLRSKKVVNGFFRELEALPFPKDKLRELYPELTNTWDVTAKLQSVPWEEFLGGPYYGSCTDARGSRYLTITRL